MTGILESSTAAALLFILATMAADEVKTCRLDGQRNPQLPHFCQADVLPRNTISGKGERLSMVRCRCCSKLP